jgi:hypothetical protein
MYCPVCLQNTLKIRSSGVIKLTFNGKSRNTSLFTFNVLKESSDDLRKKLREKVVDFMGWYAEFNNKTPIKHFEVFSSDFSCDRGCKIDLLQTKLSVVGLIYTPTEVRTVLEQEAAKFGVEVQLPSDFDPR